MDQKEKEEEMYRISTIAGNGRSGRMDGIGKEVEFDQPYGIIISRDGKELFVADDGNACIRKISLVDGTTSTIAGQPGIKNAPLSASLFFIKTVNPSSKTE